MTILKPVCIFPLFLSAISLALLHTVCLCTVSVVEIGISSGRKNLSVRLLGVSLFSRTSDTWVSRSANPSNGTPKWRKVTEVSPIRPISSHFLYHSAEAQIQLLDNLKEVIYMNEESRATIAKSLLSAWQSGSDKLAEEYVENATCMIFKLASHGVTSVGPDNVPTLDTVKVINDCSPTEKQ